MDEQLSHPYALATSYAYVAFLYGWRINYSVWYGSADGPREVFKNSLCIS